MNRTALYLGCAGWKLGREYWPEFASVGTHLARYASRLNAVEINSAFYRPHRPATYARWAASVGEAFRFSVKMPKAITHEQRLQDVSMLLEGFLCQCSALGDRLGCLLVQLPPSLAFDAGVAQAFFQTLRAQYSGDVVVEPRHESWVEAHDLLVAHRIAQAAVDPSRISSDSLPGGWQGLRYWRLHGAPRIYYSAYGDEWLERLAREIEATLADGVPTWCIFDNTARDAAVGNAVFTGRLLGVGGSAANG
ncbi:DUF72 domain-containing protein [Pseudomonas silvicola]|nr:DUF72 domain-containing protein [Pseudomonas silvicola]